MAKPFCLIDAKTHILCYTHLYYKRPVAVMPEPSNNRSLGSTCSTSRSLPHPRLRAARGGGSGAGLA